MSRTYFVFFVLGLAIVQTGCFLDQGSSASKTPTSPPSPSAAATPSASATAAAAPAADAAITLVPADEKDLDALIAKHKGKVVFVDFWALTCAPCKKAFPHTIELHKKHHGEGLAVISVNMDLLEAKERAFDFLKEREATFDNLISTYDGGGSDANEAFDIGPLPHLRLYDRKGELRHKWDGKAVDLDAKVKELLAEKE